MCLRGCSASFGAGQGVYVDVCALFGYYTIVRQWIGRLRPRSVALAAECLLFNAALAAVNLLLVYVFAIPMDAVSSNKWFWWAFGWR